MCLNLYISDLLNDLFLLVNAVYACFYFCYVWWVLGLRICYFSVSLCALACCSTGTTHTHPFYLSLLKTLFHYLFSVEKYIHQLPTPAVSYKFLLARTAALSIFLGTQSAPKFGAKSDSTQIRVIIARSSSDLASSTGI